MVSSLTALRRRLKLNASRIDTLEQGTASGVEEERAVGLLTEIMHKDTEEI